MNGVLVAESSSLWANPYLVYPVAAAAVATLLLTIWIFRQRGRRGRPAGAIFLGLSIALHAALIFLVPLLPSLSGSRSSTDADDEAGFDTLSFSTFDPEMLAADASGVDPRATTTTTAPLPVSSLTDLLQPPGTSASEDANRPVAPEIAAVDQVPDALSIDEVPQADGLSEQSEASWKDLLDEAFAAPPPSTSPGASAPETTSSLAETRDAETSLRHDSGGDDSGSDVPAMTVADSPAAAATAAMVPGTLQNDFANRVGKAKEMAIAETGGDADTEAAVQAALRFLTQAQRHDGAWDPQASGAGVERSTLGMSRPGAGRKCESALTGLALLSLIGGGHTHQQGEHAPSTYRGLVYLIQHQKPDGSLAGNASLYEATYCHAMAALAICETAAITRDRSATDSATRAIRFTRSMQHPTTGGWRYTLGDPGDLSQLGWQAMVLDGGYRAGITIDDHVIRGVQRFLRNVRAGSAGGLASYRAGEAPSRTMTAEALATRLLIGQSVPDAEIAEAEAYLLRQLPGVGQDNYYYWYYATLALHQLQDDAWDQWNAALKKRLLATQRSDGSWPASTVWGGYGGTVYTTAMATLCLEVYYRHAIRSDAGRIADRNLNPALRQIRR